MSDSPCCSPQRGAERGVGTDEGLSGPLERPAATGERRAAPRSMVELKGGAFTMGTDEPGYPDDGEGPARSVEVSAFAIDETAVTVDDFSRFVDATGHTSDAEEFGWSFVFGGLLPDDFAPTRGVQATPWWRQVHGADWRHPEGPGSSIEDRRDHPVVHVSWRDASAYCDWAGVRLPTEAEWEYGARGGTDTTFWWGNELEPGGRHLMNVWQGSFPDARTPDDGFYGTCPVRSFEPNPFGLHETTGNVWEWCADVFAIGASPARGGPEPVTSPEGGPRVMKGGSYLCHASYCHRYRPAARAPNTPDTTTGHLGFRTVRSLS